MFLNAIIGFIIVLSAWLIIDTVMRALVGTEDRPGQLVADGTASGYLFWSDVQCQEMYVPGYTKPETIGFAAEISSALDESFSDTSYAVTNPTNNPAIGTVSGPNCPAALESSMVQIPGTSFKARSNIANNFVRMRTAAAAAGITLKVSSGWRSEAVQVGIWKSKGCDVNPANCISKAARPCSYGGTGSNHNSGNAVDISMPNNTTNPTFMWLKNNGSKFGFYNNLGARDVFHWSPSGR